MQTVSLIVRPLVAILDDYCIWAETKVRSQPIYSAPSCLNVQSVFLSQYHIFLKLWCILIRGIWIIPLSDKRGRQIALYIKKGSWKPFLPRLRTTMLECITSGAESSSEVGIRTWSEKLLHWKIVVAEEKVFEKLAENDPYASTELN